MTDRTEERRELFWKQLHRADRDVQEWPDYVKQALIKPARTETALPPVAGRESSRVSAQAER
jgi:hypothetical protein